MIAVETSIVRAIRPEQQSNFIATGKLLMRISQRKPQLLGEISPDKKLASEASGCFEQHAHVTVSARPRDSILIGDSTPWGNSAVAQLREKGFDAIVVESMQYALARVDSRRPALVVTELRIGEHHAFELIAALRQLVPTIPVVVVTAFASIGSALAALKLGALDFIAKPVSIDLVLESVSSHHTSPGNSFMTLDQARAAYISEMLAHCGSISAAARALGVDRRSLRRMIARYAQYSPLAAGTAVMGRGKARFMRVQRGS